MQNRKEKRKTKRKSAPSPTGPTGPPKQPASPAERAHPLPGVLNPAPLFQTLTRSPFPPRLPHPPPPHNTHTHRRSSVQHTHWHQTAPHAPALVQVQHRATASKAIIVAAKVHALDRDVGKGSGTHDARLARHVQRALGQHSVCAVAVRGGNGLDRYNLRVHRGLQSITIGPTCQRANGCQGNKRAVCLYAHCRAR